MQDMTDTLPDADALVTALLAARSGSERVRMTCEMFDAAKTLMTADLRAQRPDMTSAELRRQVFDRLYSQDFDAETRARILAALG